MLADDQRSVRLAVKLLVEQQPEGNVIEEITNTSELFDRVNSCRLDMLLLDWNLLGFMPEKRLRELLTLCPGLFIVVLDSRPQTRQAAIEAGADAFVSKFDPPERLLDVIKISRPLRIKP